MNTNSVNLMVSFGELTGTIFGSVSDGLSGALEELEGNGTITDLMSVLVGVIASLLVVWGVWFVLRKLMRSVRATK